MSPCYGEVRADHFEGRGWQNDWNFHSMSMQTIRKFFSVETVYGLQTIKQATTFQTTMNIQGRTWWWRILKDVGKNRRKKGVLGRKCQEWRIPPLGLCPSHLPAACALHPVRGGWEKPLWHLDHEVSYPSPGQGHFSDQQALANKKAAPGQQNIFVSPSTREAYVISLSLY